MLRAMRPRARRREPAPGSVFASTLHVAELDRARDLHHDLHAELEWIKTMRSHAQLRRHPRYPLIHEALDAVLEGFEWRLDPPRAPACRDRLRVAAWNIERGKRFGVLTDFIERHELLRTADVLLLNEVDIGMGRSENRDVPRELAERFGHAYVFANCHLVVSPGDAGERYHGRPNRRGLHGNAILSRYPIRRFTAVTLPEYRDKLGALEQRLGNKRAVLAELELDDGPITVGAVHLDPFAPAHYRAHQVRLVLRALEAFERQGPPASPRPRRCLLGGDLNTVTYDLSNPLGLAWGLVEKGLTVGVAGAIDHYMTPEIRYERPVFDALRAGAFHIEGFNDRAHGTLHFDANDPELVEKATAYLPLSIFERLARRLDPWDRRVPMRLDWFAGRNLAPLSAHVVPQPPSRRAQASDHDPIVVDVAL